MTVVRLPQTSEKRKFQWRRGNARQTSGRRAAREENEVEKRAKERKTRRRAVRQEALIKISSVLEKEIFQRKLKWRNFKKGSLSSSQSPPSCLNFYVKFSLILPPAFLLTSRHRRIFSFNPLNCFLCSPRLFDPA